MPDAGWAVRAPHPALRHLVTRYVGYTGDGSGPGVHRGLPSRHATLVLALTEPVRVLGPSGATALRAAVGGLHTAPVLIAQGGYETGIHVELNPLGTRTLLGLPAAELAGHVAGAADAGAARLAALSDRLAAEPTWAGRFALLDAALLAEVRDAAGPPEEVGWAWRRLVATCGGLRIADLAAEVGWSRRHLGERFRREFGLGPKQAARVLRFERAGRLLRAGGPRDLAELAATCGYYDQAHLTHEWQAFAGCPPGRWIAEELPALVRE
ncbi:AraC-like DNA-binding protein [Prauserella shujinwangii]|uniref:AraC-like DNA-binding protein n=1 Tax=Prauserella shujinwangii TaxID=1453103 RepID=A0A2T0LWL8_9PSEU|nr:helix-turn-helix domain-containing protein [Prauserella shujinwangii]PRX48422.1 AraC-like DNA-binding protein [Prauserella shujinwangii]